MLILLMIFHVLGNGVQKQSLDTHAVGRSPVSDFLPLVLVGADFELVQFCVMPFDGFGVCHVESLLFIGMYPHFITPFLISQHISDNVR